MGLTRSSSGLLIFDNFSTDVSGSYDPFPNAAEFSVGSGVLSSNTTAWGLRAGTSGCNCVTMRTETLAGNCSRAVLFAVSPIAANEDIDTYYAYVRTDTHYLLAKRNVDNASDTTLVSVASVTTGGSYHLQRIYRSSGVVYARGGETALGSGGSTSDATHSGTLYGGVNLLYDSGNSRNADWCDYRTSHLITCTGMTEGHYLRVSDGTTAAEAAANGAGLATVDAGAVLFPLATVQIRTAAAGGGDLIAELDTGDYADMGGGDAFAYSSDLVVKRLMVRKVIV